MTFSVKHGDSAPWLQLGAALAAESSMPDVSGIFNLGAANLIGGLVFGSIGFVAFMYGKRMTLWKMMFCGLALMIFPYFVANTIAVYAIGIIGSGALIFLRE